MSSTHPFRQVAEDIFQVHLPLPFALNRVNCYLIQGAAGWTILDTGLNTPAAQTVWRSTFKALDLHPTAIKQIVLTHTHPDHYGMAGWLQTFCRDNDSGIMPSVFMSAKEAKVAGRFWAPGEAWKKMLLDFWRSCAVPVELAMALTASTGQTRLRILPHPTQVKIIQPDTVFLLGEREVGVLQMGGHSDGHLLFYDSKDRLLLGGDQVLIDITSNVSLWPYGEPHPLAQYLSSLERLAALDVRLCLPGHRADVVDLRGRIAELQEHHRLRLNQAAAAAAPSITPYEAARQLFPFDRLSVHEKRFAIAESLAHLDHLALRKRLRRQHGGALIYSRS